MKRGSFDWGLFDQMFKGDSRDIKWCQVWEVKGGDSGLTQRVIFEARKYPNPRGIRET